MNEFEPWKFEYGFHTFAIWEDEVNSRWIIETKNNYVSNETKEECVEVLVNYIVENIT